MQDTIKSVSLPAITMGALAAFVGYAASFTIVLAGLDAMGASQQQAAIGLFAATLGMSVCSVWLALKTRTPAAVAWSTPGAAFLASTTLLPDGFPAAIAAFIICAVLLMATGFVPALAQLVSRTPKPVANALLAGVLLKLCLAPALAIGTVPLLFLPVFIAWLIGLLWHRLAAMPFAVLAFIAVLVYTVNTGETVQTPLLTDNKSLLGGLSPVMPQFSLTAAISVAIPLYLITMAGQNIPGFAVLELNGFKVNRQPLLITTGFASLLLAPFGSIPVNMSAITAAMMCGEDVGEDPGVRYQAAVTCGLVFMVFAFAAGALTQLAVAAPTELIVAVAGLALLPALAASLTAAFSDSTQIEAPALTFLLAASGMTLFGIGGAFWAIVTGVIVWWLKYLKNANNHKDIQN